MRAAGACPRDSVRPHIAWMLAFLRTNDHQGTHDPNFADAWMQSQLGAPADHVPRCHVVAAHAVATGERGGHSGAPSFPRRRTHLPVPREAESCNSLRRRALRRGNHRQSRSGDANTLEPVLHSMQCPQTLDNCSYAQPTAAKIVGNLSGKDMTLFLSLCRQSVASTLVSHLPEIESLSI